MLLSRLAETMFWLGRYVERAEDLSRVIIAHEQLYLDMPRGTTSSWTPLVELCGAELPEQGAGALSSPGNVAELLVTSADNPASIYRTLHKAKDDLHLSRPLLPKESWQVLSATCDLLEALRPTASLTEISRTLAFVVEHCQRLAGQIDGGMSRDEAYSFLRMGRMLERSDVTLRVIVMLADVLTNRDHSLPFANIRWLGTLKYLAADHMFLRRYHARTEPSVAIRFLLFDPWFPRSVYHCLNEIEKELEVLPNSPAALQLCRACHQTQSSVDVAVYPETYARRALELVVELNNEIERTYFHGASGNEPMLP
ncbi:MAG TPA: alpha-E domain-containing protein [Polyangiaceae bacterium]|nr:alpha-E domain-containing protein [Polyangiaceae bacterium]